MVIRRMAWGRPGNSGNERSDGVAGAPAAAPTARDAAKATGLAPDHATALCRAYEALGLGAFWSSDADGRLTYLSPAARALLAGEGDPIGRTLLDLFHHDETQGDNGSERSLRFVLARRTRFERLTVRTGPASQPRWWSLSGEAVHHRGQFAGFHGHCADISDQRRHAEESSHMALHDPLTGLANRRHMNQTLARKLAALASTRRGCATMLIDLDRFKQVNDTLGHAAGDALLKQVADRLVRLVGDASRVCRLGGDEFQIILPEVEDRGHLGELAEALIEDISQPYLIDGSRCLIGASIGVAIAPFDGAAADDLVRSADLALYAAKGSGRGRFRFFSSDLLKAAEDRKALEEDLHDALAQGQFALHYQPIVKAQSNQVIGVEALLRWNHPEHGQVSPARFIPIAEESNLIRTIGEWVLRKACADAAGWEVPLRVAVNVSPVQFADEAFPALVTSALAQSGLDPARLELEITEGVFLEEGGQTDARFNALKGLGVRLALDDFGTGYSSLGYLKSAPFDKIKIDQSFVRGATQPGNRNRAIITAIVALAQALDMETTAEGVESFDQFDLMKALCVSHVQGFIYSQPLDNDTFVAGLSGGDWTIEPSGPARQRHQRQAMFRRVGVVHEDHYYPVVLRNLSKSGALIEGLLEVPLDTPFVLDLGDGQLVVSRVRRSQGHQQGLEFEQELVSDGNGGLCTRYRVSPYQLSAAGLTLGAGPNGPLQINRGPNAKVTMPAFAMATDWNGAGLAWTDAA
ncbi:diguanylate cyclase (GGDEF)-like protein [Novosphingobium capsulatum]|uniref:Diguanylate cyclase (GGDEF)-like protein n=1 Tax=Novosphingobium capsulatum TaxID=13688 RepID=A0ABU1MJV3_9SPHN|nr:MULTISPECIES: EAL domain-containing protein [Novosphingobium]MDR6510620.1 diguanylate cyclase (GGDEF)-like protein [Novosphingobium capsulatum]